jgi:hypothetical protein
MPRKIYGQSILEYTLIIGVVVTALIVMQVYIKRGIQAATKVAADQLSDQTTPDYLNIQDDKSSYLITSSSSAQQNGYRYEKTRKFSGAGMGKQTIINEATISSSISVYNAGVSK